MTATTGTATRLPSPHDDSTNTPPPSSSHSTARIRSRTPLTILLALLSPHTTSSLVTSSIGKHTHRNPLVGTLKFRHTEGSDSVTGDDTAAAAALAASGLMNYPIHDATIPTTYEQQQQQQQLQQPLHEMPPWLRERRGHLAASKLDDLREAMATSFLSEDESRTVITAIQDASRDDPHKVAGAADFLSILIETMEMGVHTLIAAAFHYCTCVTARERDAFLARYSSDATVTSRSATTANGDSFWDSHHEEYTLGIDKYGDDAMRIANDAAKLKRTETRANSFVRNSASSPLGTTDAENLRSLLLSEMGDWRALAIRSAASLYRLRGLIDVRYASAATAAAPLTKEEVRVSRDAIRIYAPLASRLGMHRLKNEIERAAFRIIYRRQYEAVSSLLFKQRRDVDDSSSIREGLQSVLETITEDVRQVLENDVGFVKNTARFTVNARVKEPFSLWKKMLKIGAKDDIFKVSDVLALRVVLDGEKNSFSEDVIVTRSRERALCYYVQKLCMERWNLSQGNRVKDYIAQPKPNGYQSLHFMASTPWDGEDWGFEVQVRSGEMHHVAEYGLAAHWDYKLKNNKDVKVNVTPNGKTTNLPSASDAYVKALHEWHQQQVMHELQHISQGTTANTSLPRNPPAPQTLESSRISFIKSREEMNKKRAERIRAISEQREPYIKALSTAKSNLSRDHVFVFLSSTEGSDKIGGQILSLPAGSCVSDALRHGDKDLTPMHYRIVHNGHVTNMKQRLNNGDVLMVPVF